MLENHLSTFSTKRADACLCPVIFGSSPPATLVVVVYSGNLTCRILKGYIGIISNHKEDHRGVDLFLHLINMSLSKVDRQFLADSKSRIFYSVFNS